MAIIILQSVWEATLMQKLRYTLGLPVLVTEKGIQIGQIVEILVDIERVVVCGFVIGEGSVFTTEHIVAFDDLFSLGRDAVMVRNDDVIHQFDTMLVNNKYYLRDLLDKEIFTESGMRLGVLVDIFIDSITGEMKWYQVSDSIITDLLYGRMIMPLPQTQIIGQDKVIVPESMEKLLHTEEIIDNV